MNWWTVCRFSMRWDYGEPVKQVELKLSNYYQSRADRHRGVADTDP